MAVCRRHRRLAWCRLSRSTWRGMSSRCYRGCCCAARSACRTTYAALRLPRSLTSSLTTRRSASALRPIRYTVLTRSPILCWSTAAHRVAPRDARAAAPPRGPLDAPRLRRLAARRMRHAARRCAARWRAAAAAHDRMIVEPEPSTPVWPSTSEELTSPCIAASTAHLHPSLTCVPPVCIACARAQSSTRTTSTCPCPGCARLPSCAARRPPPPPRGPTRSGSATGTSCRHARPTLQYP